MAGIGREHVGGVGPLGIHPGVHPFSVGVAAGPCEYVCHGP